MKKWEELSNDEISEQMKIAIKSLSGTPFYIFLPLTMLEYVKHSDYEIVEIEGIQLIQIKGIHP